MNDDGENLVLDRTQLWRAGTAVPRQAFGAVEAPVIARSDRPCDLAGDTQSQHTILIPLSRASHDIDIGVACLEHKIGEPT
ncbi:MAG: hypothetical protein AAF281_04490 [Pseudomonadota bacterium]